MATIKAQAPKPLIKAATIATVLDKVSGAILGFLVKSNRTQDYYQVQTEVIGGERLFFCDCEAHLWGYDTCCHIKAVQEVLIAKAELAQAEAEAALLTYANFEAVKAEVALMVPPAQPVETVEAAQPVETVPASLPVVAAPIFPRGQTVAIARAPQFNAAQLKQLSQPANAGFSLLKPTW